MKKNVFSRTLAVLASTAVLGAASMMSASAEGESLSLSSAEAHPGETVTIAVNVTCNNKFESANFMVSWEDTALTAAKGVMAQGVSGASEAYDGYVTVVPFGSDAIADGTIATIDFTVPADATPGTVYSLAITGVETFAIFEGDDIAETVPTSGGTITVVEDTPAATDATDATDATTPATTAAATTTAKAATTGAPKTGNAGVAVAVAGLVAAGATAVVLKKRH